MWLQLQTVDHSVRWSMKNAASCVKRCEMQDTPSTWFSNAYCSLRSFLGLRLSEGRYDIKIIIQVCEVEYAVKKLLYSSDLFIHLTVWSVSLWTGGRMRVIVQFIDDNSRTLHVLLVFDFLYDFSFKRHVS